MGQATSCCDGKVEYQQRGNVEMSAKGKEQPVPVVPVSPVEIKQSPEPVAAKPASPPPAASASPSPVEKVPEQRTISLKKNGKLGCGLNQKALNGTALKVESISPDGFMAKHNAANKDDPLMLVNIGDLILSVNSTRGDAKAMVAALGKSDDVKLLIKTGVPAKQWEVTLDKSSGPLGLAMKLVGNHTEIAGVRPGGKVDEHNKANPEDALKVGDVIVSANGEKTGIDKVVQASQKIVFKLLRDLNPNPVVDDPNDV